MIIVDIITVKGMTREYIVTSLFLAKQRKGGNLVSNTVKPPDASAAMEGIKGARTPTMRDKT